MHYILRYLFLHIGYYMIIYEVTILTLKAFISGMAFRSYYNFAIPLIFS